MLLNYELTTNSKINTLMDLNEIKKFEGALNAQKKVKEVQRKIENKQDEYKQFLYGE